ncbi:uncharacterized protein LOC136087251 [Hydra vulgaris]|uniref:Uncharacterized protein LOC136087251 n=1 Tax=Hydra vulgaris TaxID=6087 RepID=A0ABM4CV29_HYDVU
MKTSLSLIQSVDPNGGEPEKGGKFENEATDHLHEKPLKSQHLSKEIQNSNVELNKSPAQKLGERMYTQWSTEQEELLEEMFGKFIRDKNFGWPKYDEIKVFCNQTGIREKALRNKINNERVKWTSLRKKRTEELNI